MLSELTNILDYFIVVAAVKVKIHSLSMLKSTVREMDLPIL